MRFSKVLNSVIKLGLVIGVSALTLKVVTENNLFESPEKLIERQTELFLESLKAEDKINLRATFIPNLAKRFTTEQMLDFVIRENIIPLTDWTILESSISEKKGVGVISRSNQ